MGGDAAAVDTELNQLEEVILCKVQQRIPTRLSEETYIVKVCKYHDLAEAGHIDLNNFKRAFAPFTQGIFDQDVRLIFDRYACDGALFYKQFAAEFVRGTRRDQAQGLMLGSEAEAAQAWEGPEDALLRMKTFLCGKGPQAILGLATAFREMDPDNTRAVGGDAFHTIIGELFSPETGCPVPEGTADQIFQIFQQQYAPGQLAYDEFLQAFKDEPLSTERRDVVRAAFRRMDTNSEGLVDINDMMRLFNPGRHPQVCDGSRQADDIVEEFVETFQDCIAYRRGQRSYPTTLVAWEEFEDYYKFVSACCESDALFCAVLQRVWDLDKAPNTSIEKRAALARPAAGIPAKSRTGLHHWQSNTLPTNVTHNTFDEPVNINSVMNRLRRSITKRGLRAAVDVVKHFYAADDDVDDLLDMYDFRRACQASGIVLQDAEEQVVFDVCGVDPTGDHRHGRMVHLQRFLQALHGPMPGPRQVLVERAFRALGGALGDEDSVVNPATLKQNFCAEAHPLVVKGEMDAGVLLGEFLDTFSLLAHVRGGCQNGEVAFSDFMAYYEVVSSLVESDALFDILMHRLWPIDAQTQEIPPDSPTRSPSKRERWAAPVFDAGDQAVPRQRPCAAAVTALPPESHRRFSRTVPPVSLSPEKNGTGSAMTRSSIVFSESFSGELSAMLERLRASLSRRGLKAWRTLSERFQQYDNKKNGGIMRGDWQRVHRTMGLGLSPEEQEAVFKSFAQGRRDGSMDYCACLRAVRGPLAERRTALVGRLFDELREGGDIVPGAVLKARFDARSTPMCALGSRDAASERADFEGAVDYFSGDGGLDAQSFTDFFTMLSSAYPEEDEFKLMTTTAFGIHGASIGGC